MTEVTEKKEPSPAELPLEARTVKADTTPARESVVKTEKPQQEEPAAKKGGGSAIAAVALLIAAGATAAGYGGWHQLNQKQAALEGRIAIEEQALSGLQSAKQSETTSMQSLQQQIAALSEGNSDLKQHNSQLEERLAEISQRLEARSSNEWLVTEARHLIVIANQQAQLNYNTKAALAALEAADQRLQETDEPSLLKARQMLSNDMATLRAIPLVDTTGIALLLSQLEEQVAGLPLARDDDEESATPTSDPQAPVSGAEGFFLKIWHDIKGLVTIRHSSGPLGSATATPAQRIYLQQNLRLKLEVARLALLQRDTQTFRSSITTLQQWLEQYFDTKATPTAAMLTSLAPFATLELQPELPDISSALHLLDTWQEQHKNRTKVEAPLKRETTAS